ncbi:MAG: hypothetical protein ACYDHT_13415, partial [Solirubrobacteraceae bacterium]
MAPSVRVLSDKLAGRVRQYAPPAAWRAAGAERLWSMRAPCAPQALATAPAALPEVYWPTRYEWPLADGWVGPLRVGLSGFTTVQQREIEQPYMGIVLFEVGFPGEASQTIAVDYYDYT